MGVIDHEINTLAKRAYNCYGYGNYYDDCNTSWGSWGRWVLLVAIIVGVLILFFLFSCITARRRRRQGIAPYRGTGWLAPGHGPVQYYGPGGPNQQHPPGQQPSVYAHYGPQQPYTGNEQYQTGPAPPGYQASQHGYYGNEGVEMQPPQQAHAPGGYAPPPGPPPGKGDGVVR